MQRERPIRVLKDAVARKIAAGEVIDRPQAVLRELLDNSLDSGATRIEVRWVSGGMQSLEVVDDGAGMSRADLEICWLPHTTSKIETEEDLDALATFGFRGEALASIAACSRLTITSCRSTDQSAHRLTLEEGRAPILKSVAGIRGTRVLVEDLYATIPARRKFLKSAATESGLLRRTFDEKALSAPHVAFELWIDGTRKVNIPSESQQSRIGSILGSPWLADQILTWSTEGPGFSLHGYAVKPPQSRSDRKGLRIYANQRPLQEFALVQALCYAYEGYLPGGAYPYGILYLDVDPSLVDFNIHPAKREARFRILPAIHQAVVASLRSALEAEKLRFPGQAVELVAPQSELFFEAPSEDTTREDRPIPVRGRGQIPSVGIWDRQSSDSEVAEPSPASDAFRYLGQVLGVFLIAEVGDTLYLVDQHAAHERILFDAFRDHGGKIQSLLFPREFHPEDDCAELLESQWESYSSLGIGIRPAKDGAYELTYLPQTVAGLERVVIDFVRSNVKPVADIEKDLYASLSCRAAVMDGDPLDPEAAKALLRKTFALEHARCPHGRPLWTTLTRTELFERVGRIV